MEEGKRYIKNIETAKEIFEMLGFQLSSFNPDWRVYITKNEGHPLSYVDVPDIFIERLALALGKKWMRFVNTKEIKKNLEREDNFLGIYKDMVNTEINENQKTLFQEFIQNQEENIQQKKEAIVFVESIKGMLDSKKKAH